MLKNRRATASSGMIWCHGLVLKSKDKFITLHFFKSQYKTQNFRCILILRTFLSANLSGNICMTPLPLELTGDVTELLLFGVLSDFVLLQNGMKKKNTHAHTTQMKKKIC